MNVPREARVCHRKLTLTAIGGNILSCIRTECSIYDDDLEQCGELTTIQTMSQLSRILKLDEKLKLKELAAYRN